MVESLSDKLKSLGLNIGSDSGHHKENAGIKAIPIERVLEGCNHATIYGETFTRTILFPEDYVHGTVTLSGAANIDMILAWAKIPSGDRLKSLQNYIFLDAETSGLSGGTGTFAFLIGLGYFTDKGFQVSQIFMRDPSQEDSLLATLAYYVSQHYGIVTFNGKSFDIPLLNGRHILHGISNPLKQMAHIDLLPLSRRIWKNRIDDRSLKNLEVQILDYRRNLEEVPGWMVPEIYFDYLKTGDATPLSGVFYHNLYDIVSLAALMEFLSGLLEAPLRNSDIDSLDLIAIARLHEEANKIDEAIRLYERSLLQGLPEALFVQTLMRYAEIYRSRQQSDLTLGLWQRAAEFGHIEACIELSKYYEHQKKNYIDALQWIDKAFSHLGLSSLPENKKQFWIQEFQKRKTRLEMKIQRGEPKYAG